MNYNAHVLDFEVAYGRLLEDFLEELNSIKDPKHKVKIQQDFDKMVHYLRITLDSIIDLNQWFSAFGSPGEKQ